MGHGDMQGFDSFSPAQKKMIFVFKKRACTFSGLLRLAEVGRGVCAELTSPHLVALPRGRGSRSSC